MNNMKKQTSELQLLGHLSESVGDFISYWGFRHIHGQVWCQIYLSTEALSGADLTKRLGVSKALISPALAELENYGLIKAMPKNLKTKNYQAELNVTKIIKSILKNRELKIVSKSGKCLDILKAQINKNKSNTISSVRLENLEKMISSAQFFLTLATQTELLDSYAKSN